MDEDHSYRRALGAFATGVVLITAEGAHGPVGIIVNSFTSVSLEPRLVLWCLGDQSDRYGAFSTAEHWAVNVLAADQQSLSAQFAQSGVDEVADAVFEQWDKTPVLRGALARIVCRTHERRKLGDHLVIVGEVTGFDTRPGDSLTYYRGRYGVAATES